MSDVSPPSPGVIIDRAVRRILGGVHTITIGYIEAYDAARGEADVQPATMAPFYNELGVRVPYRRAVIPHVLVLFPGGGGTRDTWPVKRGDACILLHCSTPIAKWSVQGGIVDEQNDTQRHNLSNAIAIVGISDFGHFAPAHATARVVGEGAADVRIGDQDAADPVIRKSDLDAVVAKLNSLTALYNAHVHGGVTTGVGISAVHASPETSMIAPSGSPNVKVP